MNCSFQGSICAMFKPKLDQPQQKITRKFQITPNKEPTLSFFIHSNQFLRTGPPKKKGSQLVHFGGDFRGFLINKANFHWFWSIWAMVKLKDVWSKKVSKRRAFSEGVGWLVGEG